MAKAKVSPKTIENKIVTLGADNFVPSVSQGMLNLAVGVSLPVALFKSTRDGVMTLSGQIRAMNPTLDDKAVLALVVGCVGDKAKVEKHLSSAANSLEKAKAKAEHLAIVENVDGHNAANKKALSAFYDESIALAASVQALDDKINTAKAKLIKELALDETLGINLTANGWDIVERKPTKNSGKYARDWSVRHWVKTVGYRTTKAVDPKTKKYTIGRFIVDITLTGDYDETTGKAKDDDGYKAVVTGKDHTNGKVYNAAGTTMAEVYDKAVKVAHNAQGWTGDYFAPNAPGKMGVALDGDIKIMTKANDDDKAVSDD